MLGLIEYVGEDEGDLMFQCPSFTTVGVVYTIILNKADAVVSCDCMDCYCRKKQWHLYADNPDICKHLRAFRESAIPFFKQAGVL